MTHFITVWEGFCVMIACLMLSMIMTLMGGALLDVQDDQYTEHGAYNSSTEIGTATLSTVRFVHNLYFAVTYFFDFFGIFVFILSIFNRQRYDRRDNIQF